MHRIAPPMTPLKNDVIIENDVVFGQKLFLLITSLLWCHQQKTKNFEKLCDSLPKCKIWVLCHFWFWS